ncbi:type II toxin-antitoxin system VapC family toxin [Sulfurisphaera javensis]|uniref:Type II toxin-antitoxin system VapC family toxin n=1 Tax=Sulfurisphaera javensis TaxID=2049879 RepID=A0AAT9GTQ6_9CREN
MILDTGFFINYFTGKCEACRKVIEEAYANKVTCLTTYLNLTELFYLFAKRYGKESAINYLNLIKKSPINVVNLDDELVVKAGELKLKYNTLSLVDVFIIALAEREKGKIYTTDSEISKVHKDTVLLS